MSLLLEALQRAAKEKEKSASPAATAPSPASEPDKRAPDSESATIPSLDGIVLEPLTTSAPADAVSRSASAPELRLEPTIEQPVAVPVTSTSATFPAPVAEEPKPAPVETTRAPEPPPAAATPAPPPPRAAAQPGNSRVAREILNATARKKKAPANRRALLLGGIAVVLGMGMGALLFIQTQNPSTLTPATLPPVASPTPEAAANPTPAQIAAVPVTVTAPTPSPPAAAATPAPTPAPVVANPATPPAQGERKPSAQVVDSPAPIPAPAGKSAAPAKPVFTARSSGPGPLDQAYAALLEGRLDQAGEAYRQALAGNPDERDALLGLAHIAHRQGRRDEARQYYQRVLRLEPENTVASAGLLSLQTSGDPQSAIARARDMTDRQPESAAAFATLGDTLAREGRLADAQQAFFRAMTLEPENPLHAYNLAVALDRMHKYGPARTYYEKAVALAEKAPRNTRSIPVDDAVERLQQLRLHLADH